MAQEYGKRLFERAFARAASGLAWVVSSFASTRFSYLQHCNLLARNKSNGQSEKRKRNWNRRARPSGALEERQERSSCVIIAACCFCLKSPSHSHLHLRARDSLRPSLVLSCLKTSNDPTSQPGRLIKSSRWAPTRAPVDTTPLLFLSLCPCRLCLWDPSWRWTGF